VLICVLKRRQLYFIYKDKEKRLITRWDNAPHHSEIETFPDHVHEGEEIKPSEEPTFAEILKKIGERI